MMSKDHEVNYACVYDLEVWKAKLLSLVVDAFATQFQGDIQRNISAWRYSDDLPFPASKDIRINGGCMTFEVDVADKPVFFSFWYTFGEVRFGIRIPHDLMKNPVSLGIVEKKIAAAYDGQPCHKVTNLSNGMFFDWIFRDQNEGFASFSTGVKGTQDEMTTLAIASKLTDVLVHLYMATLNILIENGGLKVTIKKVKAPLSLMYLILEVYGDLEAFEYKITREHKGKIENKVAHMNRMIYTISGENLTIGSISLGDHRDQDGSVFSITDRKVESAQNMLYGDGGRKSVAEIAKVKAMA